MFGLGFTEVVLIAVVAILVLGPERLPELGKILARLIGEVRKVNRDIRQTISDVERSATTAATAASAPDTTGTDKTDSDAPPPTATQDTPDSSPQKDDTR